MFYNLEEHEHAPWNSYKSWIFNVEHEAKKKNNFYVLKCQWALILYIKNINIKKTCYLWSTPIIISTVIVITVVYCILYLCIRNRTEWVLLLLMYWHEWIINVTLLTELAMKENICEHVTLMMMERKYRGRSPW